MSRIFEPFDCPECFQSWDNWQGLRTHMGRMHPDAFLPMPERWMPGRGHGTISFYNTGCRCDDCRRAAREAKRLMRVRAHNRRLAGA